MEASLAYLLALAVFLLMLSVGTSLDHRQFVANWRRLTPGVWARLVLATFVIPPLLALALGKIMPIDIATMSGLFLIAVAPGAPLMIRNAGKHGFDMEVAASYQVWGSLVAPIAIPVLVGGAAKLFGRDIWISPLEVLGVIAKKQFAPLLAGMALMYLAPGLAMKVRRPANVAGNVLLTVGLIALLVRLGPSLTAVRPWLFLAAVALAMGCLASARLLIRSIPTLAVSNVNRHVGLALLLSEAHLSHAQRVIPSIAAYALAAPLVMAFYSRWARRARIRDSLR